MAPSLSRHVSKAIVLPCRLTRIDASPSIFYIQDIVSDIKSPTAHTGAEPFKLARWPKLKSKIFGSPMTKRWRKKKRPKTRVSLNSTSSRKGSQVVSETLTTSPVTIKLTIASIQDFTFAMLLGRSREKQCLDSNPGPENARRSMFAVLRKLLFMGLSTMTLNLGLRF